MACTSYTAIEETDDKESSYESNAKRCNRQWNHASVVEKYVFGQNRGEHVRRTSGEGRENEFEAKL